MIRVDNAPGLVWKDRGRRGQEARWQARTDIVQRGYPTKSELLWGPSFVDPTEQEIAWISDRCQRLQDEMLLWSRGGVPEGMITFDGTLGHLITLYQDDDDSTFRKLRFRTRQNHATILRRLTASYGALQLSDINARALLRWHERWSENNGVSMAHEFIGQLRVVLGFGSTFLEDDQCARLRGVLSGMRFKNAKPRTEALTAEQASAVCRIAHDLGLSSIALAQAFQFECTLRQRDVIGEWVPWREPGTSEVTSPTGAKWLHGIRWTEIDRHMILRHVTSKTGKPVEIDLTLAPMVMQELERLEPLPATGPVIVCEGTGRPWSAVEFRRQWRRIANLAGVPQHVRNMDSRAGAITEATEAGADLEHVKHAASHSDIGMTQRYSRGSVGKVAEVMRLRVAHRKDKT